MACVFVTMRDVVALEKLQEALNSYGKGDGEAALTALAGALGAEAPTEAMRLNLDRLMAAGTLPNHLALQLVASEVKKRRT